MTTRLLPPAEWSKLDETLLASVWRSMNPAHAEVIVVEDDGRIVASAALLTTLHVECCSNDGGTGAMRALWTALRARVKAAGGRAFWGAAVGEPMRSILAKHGEAIPGEHFLMRA